MDPASITGLVMSAVGAAGRTISALKALKKAGERIDETIEGLQVQVEAMYDILNGLEDVLEEPGLETHIRNANAHVTKSVPATIKNCGMFLQRVKSEADQIQRSQKPGPLSRTVKTVRYQWSKTDIYELLDHAARHLVHLQMIAMVVHVYPAQPASELTERVERLEQGYDALKARVDGDSSSAALANDHHLMNMKTDECTASLVRFAARALSNASSSSGRCSSGARSIVAGQPVFQYLDEAISRDSRTVRWLDDPIAPGHRVDLPVSKPPSQWEPTKSILGRSEPFDHRSAQLLQPETKPQFYIPNDEDGSITLEHVTKMFRAAESFAERGLWNDADQELTDAFMKTRNFSDERRERLHLLERKILHGKCKMELGDYDVGNVILADVIDSYNGDPQYRPVILQALYASAEIGLRRGKCNTANEYCQQALSGQEAFFGDKHEDYFACLALLSKIMLAMGDPMEARNYARRLPVNMKAKQVQELNELSTQESQLDLYPDMGPSLAGYTRPYFKLRETEAGLSSTPDYSPGTHMYISTAADFRERTNSATSEGNPANGFLLYDDIDDESEKSPFPAVEDDYMLRTVWSAPVKDSIAESFQKRSLSMSSADGVSATKRVPLITPSCLRYDEFVQKKAGNSEEWYVAVEIQAKMYDGEKWDQLDPFTKIEHWNGTLNLEIGRLNWGHLKGANHPSRRLHEPFFHQIAFWKDGSEPTCECTIEYDLRSHGLCFQSVSGTAWLNGELAINSHAFLREDFQVYLSGSQANVTPSPRRSSWIAQAKDVKFEVILQEVQLARDPDPFVGYWLKGRRDFR